jgi:hypothetical protein
MLKKVNYLYILAIFVPAIIAFKSFFQEGPLAFGDAPYYASEHIRTFLSEPIAWVSWGKMLGGVSDVLWIHPYMLLWAALSQFFNVDNAIATRLIFYFPSLLLSIISPILLTRYLKYSRLVQFFTALLYTFNTYFILLIDGGKVGVALSYGLFPLALMLLLKLDRPNITRFYAAFITFNLLIAADLRIAIVCFLTYILWPHSKPWKLLIIFCSAVLGLNLYWLIPLATSLSNDGGGGTAVSDLQLNSLLNSFTLFQPHWYLNQYGKVSFPYYYFLGIPVLILLSILIKKRQNYLLLICFLIFAFLAKGTTPPLGFVYDWFINNFPFGFAFRDSTKFFVPLILIAGILIGMTVSLFKKKFGNVSIILIYIYILVLVSPVFLGKMNGNLSGRQENSDIKKINSHLQSESGFFRSAWFTEQSPMSYYSDNKFALHAKDLISIRPIASINAGNDAFNYMYQDGEYKEWFDLLGIKYLIFSGNPRVDKLPEGEAIDWEILKNTVATEEGLIHEDWSTNIPVYSLPQVKPHIFSVKKALFVLGGDEIYRKLEKSDPSFSIGNQAIFFLEDGKWDPQILKNIPAEKASILLNDKGETNFTFSLLQKYFIGPVSNINSDWAIRGNQDYLKWKYEFLLNGIESYEFDYNLGMAFSTQKGEKIEYKVKAPTSGKYMIGVRTINKDVSVPIQIEVDNKKFDVITENAASFSWHKELIDLTQGDHILTITNNSSFSAINALAIVPESEWNNSSAITAELLNKFESESTFNTNEWNSLGIKQLSPVRYAIEVPEASWLVFTDKYNSGWTLSAGENLSKPLPAYSIINAYYINNPGNVILNFKGQEYVRLGEKLSGISAIILLLAFAYFRYYDKKYAQ